MDYPPMGKKVLVSLYSVLFLTGFFLWGVSARAAGVTAAPATAAATYVLSHSDNEVLFGDIRLGSSEAKSVTFKNTGTGELKISEASVSGGGFSVSGLPKEVSLAAGATITLTVKFAPTGVGSVKGTLSVASDATNSPAKVALYGTGVEPVISVTPSSVSFTDVSVGSSASQAVFIRNTGTDNLIVSAESLPGGHFTLSGLTTPLTLAPGTSTGFMVYFHPTSASDFHANLSLTNNSQTSPMVLPISGSSVASVLQLSASPTSISFAGVATNTSDTKTVTLTNTGNASVTLSKITTSGTGFSTAGISLPLTLEAQQSTSFTVVFDPASAGDPTGSVVITSNASNSPLTIALSGTATAPAAYSVNLTWTPGTSAVGFNIYRGTLSGGPYTKLNSSELSSASYTDTTVTAGKIYYYVATDVNSAGQESSYSSQASATIP